MYRHLALILFVLPAVPMPRDAAALAEAGKDALWKGDYRKSAELFEQAVKLAPNSSEYHLWLGRAYGRRAENSSILTAPRWASRCRQQFEKAVQLDAKNLEAISDLFSYYLEAPGIMGGGVDKAEQLASRIEPLDAAQYHHARARIAAKRKQWETAEREYRAAVDKAPDQPGRMIDLACFLARQGRTKDADAAFARAEALAPGKPALIFARASVYVETGINLETARSLLKRYLDLPLTYADPPRREAEKLLRQAGG
ncbi:MAG: tetratricopeptide repeat protein [Bryobacteraceae bacterium]